MVDRTVGGNDTVSHDWNVTVAQAREIQRQLRQKVRLRDNTGRVYRVAGVDVGFEEGGRVTRAAVVLLSYPRLGYLGHALVKRPTTFPYVPGLLSFRECPAIIEALGLLERRPHLVICDGQGYAHPARFGLACHLGVVLDIPTIGVAKSRLVGSYQEPDDLKGAYSHLRDGEETIGAVLRTRKGVKPVFVSIGHRIGLRRAINFTLGCVTRYRLPETTRWAHHLASNNRLLGQ